MPIANRAVAALALALALVAHGGAPAVAGERARQSAVVDDTVISGAVQRALDADPAFRGHRIYVETYRGAVQLSGWVVSLEQRERAAQLASQVQGVRSVTNELELDGAKPATRTAAR